MDPSIAIIIPAFNEEATIREVIIDFNTQLPDGKIYVIDNNSSDKTNYIAKTTISENNISGSVIFVKKQGKANALKEAFRLIESDIYVMVDGDHTYFARDLDILLNPIINGECDMVVGNRFANKDYQAENKRNFHNIGNYLVRSLINLFFRTDLHDIMSGYRVFSKRFIKNYPIMCEGFEIETEMTLHSLDKKYSIKEIPIIYKDRIEGSVSKLNTFRDGYKVIRIIFTILKDYRPLFFFGSLSILFALGGLIIGSFPVYEYIQFKYVYRVPSAILATGLIILSLLTLAIGLILETIAKHQRINYELRLLDEKGKFF
jgi:glycosyltransferase involved in cell wall biosynthesis